MRTEDIFEVFDTEKKWKWKSYSPDKKIAIAEFKIDRYRYEVELVDVNNNLHVSFALMKRNGLEDRTVTNTGNAIYIFSTVAKILRSYLSDHSPKKIVFDAMRDEGSRVKLYNAMARKFDIEGYTFDGDPRVNPISGTISFTFERNIIESYKDDTVSTLAQSKSDTLDLTKKKKTVTNEHNHLAMVYEVKDKNIQRAIRDYTRESSINDVLIRDKLRAYPKYEQQYKELVKLKKMGVPLPEEHHVYSGFGAFNPKDVTENRVFETPAFISASLSLKPAVKNTNFHRRNETETKDNIVHYILPKGYKGGFYIAPYSENPEEVEYLIFPHEKFRIMAQQVIFLPGNVTRNIWKMTPV